MPWVIQEVHALAGGADCGWHGQGQHWEARQVTNTGKSNYRVSSCPKKPLPSNICKCIGINVSLFSWLAVCYNSRPDQLEKAPQGAFFEKIFAVFIETVVSEYRVLDLPIV